MGGGERERASERERERESERARERASERARETERDSENITNYACAVKQYHLHASDAL